MAEPSEPRRRKRAKNAGCADPAPLYDPAIAPNTLMLEAGTVLHRIHPSKYGAVEFNGTRNGNSRFSPIEDADGEVEPTAYAADSFAGAAMETVFHDVPVKGAPKVVQTQELEHLVHSRVKVTQPLVVADLCSTGLHKLGLEKTAVIETGKRQYPQTRAFAEDLLDENPDIQGLAWMSRKDDRGRALVLFGNRIPAGALEQVSESKPLLADEDTFAKLQDVADTIGVELVNAS